MTTAPTPPRGHTTPRIHLILAMIVAVPSGCLIAIQSRLNGELARGLGDGYVAAVISFGTGLVILTIVLLLFPAGRRGIGRMVTSFRTGAAPWWHFCGGVSGAFFVLSQGFTAALLGVALFTVATVCGQTIGGLLIDRVGLGAMQAKSITWTRLFGSAIALAAVAWVVSGDVVGNLPLWVMIMPFLSGLGIGWQQAVNGHVRELSNSAFAATYLNFAVGTAILLVVAVIHVSVVGWPSAFPTNPILYFGGSLGVVFIVATVAMVRITGVLLLGLGSIAGQLIGSLLLDIALPTSGQVIAVTTVSGTVVTLLAVALAAVPSRAIRVGRGR